MIKIEKLKLDLSWDKKSTGGFVTLFEKKKLISWSATTLRNNLLLLGHLQNLSLESLRMWLIIRYFIDG